MWNFEVSGGYIQYLFQGNPYVHRQVSGLTKETKDNAASKHFHLSSMLQYSKILI